jgi:hypothetical protein
MRIVTGADGRQQRGRDVGVCFVQAEGPLLSFGKAVLSALAGSKVRILKPVRSSLSRRLDCRKAVLT